MDRDSGDFIVEEFLLPPDLEDQLLDEAEEQATGALERRVDPETGEVIIPEAPDIDPARLSDFEDQIELRDVTPHDFGRIAAQTAKQVILQRTREAERDMMVEEHRGSRVRMVVSELRGEKIDIIPYNDEPARFVAKALSPARVREVLVDDSNKQATVIVPDDQLSLAIGREGQNARLAARLTGWRVDIRSETEFAAEEANHATEKGRVRGGGPAFPPTDGAVPKAALPARANSGP